MIREIIKYPHESLLRPTNEVKDFSVIGPILDDMKETMVKANGLGLAANQINEPHSMFVMKLNNGDILEIINPGIVYEEGSQNLNEGCLSLPGETVQIPRAQQITGIFQDRKGVTQKASFYGIEAVCFLHEYDHLLGIFFLSKVNRTQRRRALRNLEK